MRSSTYAREVPIPADSEWLNVTQAEQLANLKKSRLYELKDAGEIKSFVLKAHKDSLRGRRLFSRSSIIAYLDRKAREEGIEI
jgi:hypothetical protein